MVDGLYYALTLVGASVVYHKWSTAHRWHVGCGCVGVRVDVLELLVSYSDVQSLHASFLGDLAFLAGTTADIIPLIAAQVAGVPYGYPAMEIFMTEPTPFSWGLGSVVPMPATLGDLMRAWAEAFGGATYALKTGTPPTPGRHRAGNRRLRAVLPRRRVRHHPRHLHQRRIALGWPDAPVRPAHRSPHGPHRQLGVGHRRYGSDPTRSRNALAPTSGGTRRRSPRYGERTYSFTSNAQDTTYAAAIAEDILPASPNHPSRSATFRCSRSATTTHSVRSRHRA